MKKLGTETLVEADAQSAVNQFKTLCCKSTYTRKGRAHYTCDECGDDITMHLVYLYQAYMD